MKNILTKYLRNILALIFVILLLWLFTSCKSRTVYVPVESVKTEYKDRFVRDSIYKHDSILIKMKGDSVWIEKYRYMFLDKFRTDTVAKVDSIRVPYPVVEYKEVNKLTDSQIWQIYSFRILAGLLIFYLLFRFRKQIISFLRKTILRV